jgi:hypothetical protein
MVVAAWGRADLCGIPMAAIRTGASAAGVPAPAGADVAGAPVIRMVIAASPGGRW